MTTTPPAHHPPPPPPPTSAPTQTHRGARHARRARRAAGRAAAGGRPRRAAAAPRRAARAGRRARARPAARRSAELERRSGVDHDRRILSLGRAALDRTRATGAFNGDLVVPAVDGEHVVRPGRWRPSPVSRMSRADDEGDPPSARRRGVARGRRSPGGGARGAPPRGRSGRSASPPAASRGARRPRAAAASPPVAPGAARVRPPRRARAAAVRPARRLAGSRSGPAFPVGVVRRATVARAGGLAASGRRCSASTSSRGRRLRSTCHRRPLSSPLLRALLGVAERIVIGHRARTGRRLRRAGGGSCPAARTWRATRDRDVGAGFANLRHILRLRPTRELDLSLTQEISRVRRAALATRSSPSPAESERASSPKDLERRRPHLAAALGVNYGQGFYLARPSPCSTDPPPSAAPQPQVPAAPPLAGATKLFQSEWREHRLAQAPPRDTPLCSTSGTRRASSVSA